MPAYKQTINLPLLSRCCGSEKRLPVHPWRRACRTRRAWAARRAAAAAGWRWGCGARCPDTPAAPIAPCSAGPAKTEMYPGQGCRHENQMLDELPCTQLDGRQ